MQDVGTEIYQGLYDAIVIQAANDYRKALVGVGYGSHSPEDVVRECERFSVPNTLVCSPKYQANI